MNEQNQREMEMAVLEAAQRLQQDATLRRDAEDALSYIIFADSIERECRKAE